MPSYFLGFALIVGDKIQSWDATLARFDELGITPVPTIFRGPFRHKLFDKLASDLDRNKQEGFVVRIAAAFDEAEMSIRMGKFVRAGHVQSETHWMKAELIPNRLADD